MVQSYGSWTIRENRPFTWAVTGALIFVVAFDFGRHLNKMVIDALLED